MATQSAHLIADPDFAEAISRFAAAEREDVAQTVDELERASPFRQANAAPDAGIDADAAAC